MLVLLAVFVIGFVIGASVILVIRNKSQRMLVQSFLDERDRDLRNMSKACEQAWQDGYDAA
jgi:hypothetical protein